MQITPLTHERIAEVMRLYEDFDRPVDKAVSEEVARMTLQGIRDQGGELFVASLEGSIVGTYTIYICQNLTRGAAPFAVVENVIVSLAHRRRGIGRALMSHAKSFAKNQGCFKVILQTGLKWEANHRFYESCGFSGNKVGYQHRFDSR